MPPKAKQSKAKDAPVMQNHDVFASETFFLRYDGPDPRSIDRAVVTFPDLIHPTGPGAPGWATSFLRKRGIAVLSLTFQQANWYQSEGLFEALDAARAFVGEEVALSTYGASMGGYAALLCAARLKADRAVALCPQFTIEQDIAPFERRYRDKAQEIGRFRYDVTKELADDVLYCVGYDPTHGIDRAHIALFPKPKSWRSVLLPGAGHGAVQLVLDGGAKETLCDVITGAAPPMALRNAMRAGRGQSMRYLRRMGNLCSGNARWAKGQMLETLISHAKAQGMQKFVTRWSAARGHASSPALPALHLGKRPEEIILHVGLPKTGTTSIQTHFQANQKYYIRRNLLYPMAGAKGLPHHGWFGAAMLGGDLAPLRQALEDANGLRLLLSDETIYNEALFTCPEIAQGIRAMLDGIPLRLLAITRPVNDWKRSFYKQALQNRARAKALGSAGFWGRAEKYRPFFALPEMAQLTRQDEMLGRLSTLFDAPFETIEMRKGVDIVPDFVASLDLTAPPAGPAPYANPSISDLDAELLRQANGQGNTGHALMRLLTALPEDMPAKEAASSLRPGKRKVMQNGAAGFDWDALRYTTNPPLKYTKAEFDARAKKLRAHAEKITAALPKEPVDD